MRTPPKTLTKHLEHVTAHIDPLLAGDCPGALSLSATRDRVVDGVPATNGSSTR